MRILNLNVESLNCKIISTPICSSRKTFIPSKYFYYLSAIQLNFKHLSILIDLRENYNGWIDFEIRYFIHSKIALALAVSYELTIKASLKLLKFVLCVGFLMTLTNYWF